MKKTLKVFCLFIACIALISNIYATSFLNKVFTDGNKFFNATTSHTAGNDTIGGSLANLISNGGKVPIFDVIFEMGNVLILIVTIAIGLKYIYSGIDGRADIKSNLPNYVLGIVFFYLAQAFYDLSSDTITNLLGSGNSYETFANNTYSVVTTIANVFAILGIVLVGLKYMFTAADAKADVKKQLVPVVVGIVLVYATLKVILFVYNVGSQMLQ